MKRTCLGKGNGRISAGRRVKTTRTVVCFTFGCVSILAAQSASEVHLRMRVHRHTHPRAVSVDPVPRGKRMFLETMQEA